MAVIRIRHRPLVTGLIGVQAANTVFDIVALYPVAESKAWGRWAKEWAAEDLDRLSFPARFRFVFPIVKGSSVVGLLAGFRWPRLGRITAAAVDAYFVAALGFHIRARDLALKYAPAVAMMLWSSAVLLSWEPAS